MKATPRIALVTGGGRGIGRACSLALGADCTVAVHYRSDKSAAAKTVDAIVAAGGKARAFAGDVSQAADVERLYRDVTVALGPVDIVVNNAGIAPLTKIADITLEEWAQVFDTNVRAAFLITRLALPGMVERKWGRIVTISSQAGLSGGFFVGAHYSASKGALIALSKSFARAAAGAGNVTSNCIVPGLIDTDLTRGFPAGKTEQLTKAIPMGRMGTAAEVGGVVAFLASDEASYVTGTVVPVDGGLL